MDRPAYTVLPLERADIPALIAIGAAAFVDDRHTRMKMHEKGTTDLAAELEPRESVEAAWGRPGVHMFKAVDGEGRMVGYSSWREWNFGKDVAPRTDSTPLEAPVPPPAILASQIPLERLQAKTSGHLCAMMERANRPDTHTLFCTGIAVHPSAQGRGGASALITAAADIADEHAAQSWVHLSDQPGGVRAFQKAGYRVVNALTVDLDEYASKPRPGGGTWGSYTFSFMLRGPQGGLEGQ